jgi:hypothetical protein
MRNLALLSVVAALAATAPTAFALEQPPTPLTAPIEGSIEIQEAEALQNCGVQYTQAEWRHPVTGMPVISDFCATGTTMTSYVVDDANGNFFYYVPPSPILVEDASEE